MIIFPIQALIFAYAIAFIVIFAYTVFKQDDFMDILDLRKQDRLRFDHVREENPDQSAVHMHVHTDIEIYMLIEAIGNTILKTAFINRFPAMC